MCRGYVRDVCARGYVRAPRRVCAFWTCGGFVQPGRGMCGGVGYVQARRKACGGFVPKLSTAWRSNNAVVYSQLVVWFRKERNT